MRKVFLEAASDLRDAVTDRDHEKFVNIMTHAARHFDDVEMAMGRSDKAISSLVSELEYLKNSIGKEICLEHNYSGNVHVGVIESVTPEVVVLGSIKGIKSREIQKLKLSNLRILEDKERIKYKAGKFGTVRRDFSVVFNSAGNSIDEEFISGILKGHDENIISVEIKDVYTGPQIAKTEKSVCFGVELIDLNLREIEKKIIEFFKKIGGRLR